MDQAKEVEEEGTVSPFTVEELVKLISPHAVKEIFGHLDVKNGSRLCRVSKDWKSALLLLALFNTTNEPEVAVDDSDGSDEEDSDGSDEEDSDGSDEEDSEKGEVDREGAGVLGKGQSSKEEDATAGKSEKAQKGIVFFQGTKGAWSPDYDRAKFKRFLWDEQPLLEQGTVKHFVIFDLVTMGMIQGCSDDDDDDDDEPYKYTLQTLLCQKITELPHPVAKVTFYNCIEDAMAPRNGIEELLKKVKIVRFVNCIFKMFFTSFVYTPEKATRPVKRVKKESTAKEKRWYWYHWVKRREHTLDRETMEEMKSILKTLIDAGVDRDYMTQDDVNAMREEIKSVLYSDLNLDWHLGKKEVALAVLWPYPNEQLAWLEESLKNLGRYVGAEGKKYLRDTFDFSKPHQQNTFGMYDEGGWSSSMGLQWEAQYGEDLSIMDCALLASLLSLTPGVPQPPFKLTGCLIEAT